MQPVELVRGVWLEEGFPDHGGEVIALCDLMADRIADAVLSLTMYEQALMLPPPPTGAAWRASRDKDYEAVRAIEERLASQKPLHPSDPGYDEWRMKLFHQARREVVRAKWAAGELPQGYVNRLAPLHAKSFLMALGQLARALDELANLDTRSASAEVKAAAAEFTKALPQLKDLRDSVEHAENRIRGQDKKGQQLKANPTQATVGRFVGRIATAGDAVVISDSIGHEYGATGGSGRYESIAMSPATIEVARAAVQRVYDALPWRKGSPRYYYPE